MPAPLRTVSITTPLPDRALHNNHRGRTNRPYHVAKKKARAETALLWKGAKQSVGGGWPFVAATLEVRATFPNRRHVWDMDGLVGALKPYLDAARDAEVIPDDRPEYLSLAAPVVTVRRGITAPYMTLSLREEAQPHDLSDDTGSDTGAGGRGSRQ